MDPFKVVRKLLSVAVDTLADLQSLVLAADNLNLVLTNGHGLDSVLLNSSVKLDSCRVYSTQRILTG